VQKTLSQPVPPRRWLSYDAWLALSLSGLIFLPAWQAVIDYAKYGKGYQEQGWLIIANWLLISAAIFIVRRYLSCTRTTVAAVVKACYVIVVSWFSIGTLFYLKNSILVGIDITDKFKFNSFTGYLLTIGLTTVGVALVIRMRDSIIPFFNEAVIMLSPVTLVMFATFEFFLRSNTKPGQGNSDLSGAGNNRRTVVWVLMDELDRDVLQKMLPNLKNLSKIYAEGYVFNSAVPPANATHHSAPSYWWAQIADSVQLRNDGVRVFGAGELNGTAEWVEENTIFQRRARRNESVFIQGWALPYCRTFYKKIKIVCRDHEEYAVPGQKLGVMRWLLYNNYLNKKLLQELPAEGMLGQLVAAANRFIKGSFWYFQDEILSDALLNVKAAVDSGTDLIFWHANCPHLPAFRRFDQTVQIKDFLESQDRDYENNLLICDEAVGDLLRSLINTGSEYMLVISSDHWLRQEHLRNIERQEPVPLLITFSDRENQTQHIIEQQINSVYLGRFIEAYLDGGMNGYQGALHKIDSTWYKATRIVYRNP